MTRDEIIEISLQLSERKSERQLNIQSLYRFIVQDICKRERFWWRRIQVNFNLTIAQQTYDLTNTTLFPTLAEIALDEITKFTLITAPNPLQVVELTPVFDPEVVIEMKNNVSNVQPGRYTMAPGDYKTLLIDPPDLAYSAWIVGWGMANPASDSTTQVVPLIPTWGHNTVVMGIVAKVFRFAYGSKNDKTIDAAAEYEQGIQDLQQRRQFDPNYKLQLNLTEDSTGQMSGAVRSTG